MKKIIITVVVFAAIAMVAFTLSGNKAEMEENAKLAEETSDVIPVEIASVARKKLESSLQATSTFEAISDLDILAQADGLITKMFHQKGDFVNKGTLLAQIENSSLKANLIAAKANFDKAKIDVERFTALAKKEAVTQRQLEDAKINLNTTEAAYQNAQKQLNDTYIKANAAGTINDDFFQEGSYVSKNNKLYEVVDARKLLLNVKVTASNILSLSTGQKIALSTQIYPNARFKGTLVSIGAKADDGLKYNVEIVLDNSSEKPLKPGMFAQAHFDFSSQVEGLYISREALTGSVKDPKVFVFKNGIAQLTSIKVGQIHESEMEIVAGLTEGTQVVVNGQINLENGTKIRAINQ